MRASRCNAQCSLTVVIRRKIHPRTLASPASHCFGLVIGDLIPLLIQDGKPGSLPRQEANGLSEVIAVDGAGRVILDMQETYFRGKAVLVP